MNEIKQTLQQDADALLKRLQQSRKNGTGVTLAVSDVGVLCEVLDQLKDCILVNKEGAKYFSNDGENYEMHDSLEEAKHEAECAIEHFSERLADQQLDPYSDGNFHQVGFGIILAKSCFSVDHVVTQEDADNGEYSYEVGTEIMTLSLESLLKEPSND